MKKGCLIFMIAMLLSSATFAHRLNEYLQATTIGLSRNKVSLQIRLTPGTDVARKILQDIDLNADGTIYLNEENEYVRRLTRDVSLRIDGRIVVPKKMGASFSSVQDLAKGIGDVIVNYDADFEQRDVHQLILLNRHYSSAAVYLVNCLLPADTTIRINNQTRSSDQSLYQLEFTTNGISTVNQRSLNNTDHWAAVKTYFLHGVNHILKGYDHLLFLCALVLAAASLWDLIKIVTAFTIAHSITLTLATFGLAHLPERIVEPMIAASIIFIAVQNIRWPEQANGNSRIAVAFFFGLFHGLGFAGGLMVLMHGMSTGLIWFAILGFSIGVEAGNQIVLLPLYLFLRSLRTHNSDSRPSNKSLIIRQCASAAVAIAGLYYFVISLHQ